MPKEKRQEMLVRLYELGSRRRVNKNLAPTPEQAALESLEAIAILVDDWNAELEISHKELAAQTAALAAATVQLDKSTDRLDRRTRHLTVATWVLIVATLLLAGTKLL